MMQGLGFVNLPSLLYHSYLVCIPFGMPSLHLFTFLMFFKSCIYTNIVILQAVCFITATGLYLQYSQILRAYLNIRIIICLNTSIFLDFNNVTTVSILTRPHLSSSHMVCVQSYYKKCAICVLSDRQRDYIVSLNSGSTWLEYFAHRLSFKIKP